jgi:signal transduction histidine kinase/phage shock protein PspC (stress-responsive transcriptional regulator)
VNIEDRVVVDVDHEPRAEDHEPPTDGVAARPGLRRRADRALVGGVCAGVAGYLDVEPLVVRVLFIVVALATGVGFGVYPLAWALIPAATAAGAIGYGRRSWRARFSAWREVVGIVVIIGASVLILRRAGLWLGDTVVLPLVLASCGVALILRQTSPAVGLAGEPGPRHPFAGGVVEDPGWRRWPGGILGIALVLTAALVFLSRAGILTQSKHAIGAMIVIVIAIALVFGPWFSGLFRSLASERSERIRSDERADMAAHLHDSVLQTLALIQRRADDPREVAGLARRQERELRHWLLARSDVPRAATLGAALNQAAAEVEDLYKVRVEAITVGDCPLDEGLLATVLAAREALSNAAKFAQQDEIDLYAEVGEDSVQVFVRDRGVGFDPAAIPDDRRGVRHSILERMRQHGGRAEIRSEPGGGTEVELVMELGRK